MRHKDPCTVASHNTIYKKTVSRETVILSPFSRTFLNGVRSVNRADVSASAAVDAFVGIDDVNGITFGDRLSRAFR